MSTKWMAMVVVLGVLVGCQSAEERCNAAKVEAYDAWTAWRDSVHGDFNLWADIEAAGNRARGPAIPFRDAVRLVRTNHEARVAGPLGGDPAALSTPLAERAFAAADAHWAQCSSVNP
jgi:hypothetical protein